MVETPLVSLVVVKGLGMSPLPVVHGCANVAREKWNERRSGSTWLADEIAWAIKSTTEGYEARNPKIPVPIP